MKHVDINDIVSAMPMQMTRSEKLQRWARLVRNHDNYLLLYNSLEYLNPSQLRQIGVCGSGTSFEVAVADPVFQQQGLSANPSIQGIMNFFEVSQSELHEFSCDCGGSITNLNMADRIDRLAWR